MLNIDFVKIRQKSYFCESSNKTSIYTGVTWQKDRKKWHVQLSHNKKTYHGGFFDKEEHAAMKINLLCEQFGIKHRNPTINVDDIQKVTQSSPEFAE